MAEIDYRDVIRRAVADPETFVRLTLSGTPQYVAHPLAPTEERPSGESSACAQPRAATPHPWVKATVRPVLARGERRLQIACFDAKKDVTKNFAPAEAAARIDELLAMPFPHIELQTTAGDLHVRITRKGKVLVTEGKPSSAEPPSLAHDRAKHRALPDNDPLWRSLGMSGRDGRVLPSARAKFTQVNEFLRLLDEALDESSSYAGGHPRACPEPQREVAPRFCLNGRRRTGGHMGPPLQRVHILDAGCGNAYLTFAAHHYLNRVRGIEAKVTGVDSNAELIGRCSALAREMGGGTIDFRVATIAEFAPDAPVDVVLSLHACDTATDEAIARGIEWKARVILAAPCCQHELHGKIGTLPILRGGATDREARSWSHAEKEGASLFFAGLLRHGLLRERLADLLTDTFRALALAVCGYRVATCQFVSPEHTPKNLLLRAILLPRRSDAKPGAHDPGDRQAVADDLALKRFWNVEPAIERLLGNSLTQHFSRPDGGTP